MIGKFEKQGLTMVDQLKLIEIAKEKLSGFTKEKLISSQSKNPDLVDFTSQDCEHI